ncbi:MAG: glucose-1-phosphate cytidylyltransferase [Herpetosiphon sp.]
MREETEYRPKPLVEVGSKPIIWHIMKLYAYYGFRDFVLCLGYRGNMLKEYFLNYEAMNNDFTICLGTQNAIDYHGAHEEQDFYVTLANTGLENMTGSRVKQVERYVDDDTFMVTYGDGVSDVDIAKLVDFHHSHNRLATITTVRPFSRYGVVELGTDGRVTEFSEKPQLDGWASAGFFVFNRKVFDYLDAEPGCILERLPLQRLADEGEIVAYRHHGFFFAMDTYREFILLNELWDSQKAPWKVW